METQLIDIIRFYIPKAELVIYGNSEIVWCDSRPEPTSEEIELMKISYPHDIALENCKNQAKTLISNCDWSVLQDVNISNKQEFINYRSILRNYILNPVENPVFPQEPQPIWTASN